MPKLISIAVVLCCLSAVLLGCGPVGDLPSSTCLEQASSSVVRIEYREPGAEWAYTGTGFVVASETQNGEQSNVIVTAGHVLDAPPTIEFSVRKWVCGKWSDERWVVTEIQIGPRDLARCRVKSLGLPPLVLGSATPERLTPVWGLGCHWFDDLFVFSGLVVGYLPGAKESKGDFVTDCHISPGCSGGPLFANVDGVWKVVGVAVGMSYRNGEIFPQAFYEPIEEVLTLLKQK